MTRKIRIAISGGGVAGAVTIHALLKHSHLDPHIFESAPAFKEAGIAFGVTRQARTSLALIGDSATECLKRAGGVPMKGVRFFLGEGKDAGELVHERDNEAMGKTTTTIVQRANFLREMLADIPPERMHTSKKLESVDRQGDGSLLLHFADGSTHECDILIGADGIRSTVRKIILGESDPAASPRNSGSWAVFTMHPYEKARNSIGNAPVNQEDAREYGWTGEGGFMLHNLFSNGSLVQFTVTGIDQDAIDSDKWQRTFTPKDFEELYISKGWVSHMEQAVTDLLCDEPERRGIYLFEHPHARTYVDGPICVLGDAAHATTPFQASGGGMSIEDAMVISALLGNATSPAQAQTALKVYDQVRRPRTQKIVDSSWVTGKMLMGVDESAGMDPKKLKEALLHRWDFILDFDIPQHREEALNLLKQQV
ncbi:hypothetical protein M409DRAFT_21731 [Zasmidium cellare ATCC 36951]|uniref:FAD-binding domain-containing protein n=1 Tax=Zasmidium cellare ATCC 36951 TaxID=1080233 RepID=A0A6A6CM98_ZASCE|nr:uncharacterized protein M409DRAFT_21731 [Zasmidium cellare ATCC 36951]KAF2168294.1 hypothetical protein M409DRAFT_21731 [Zasmidium cellare ATCC 36951]